MSGRVEGRTVVLNDGYEVPSGARMEGWALEEEPAREAGGPMTADEARRLLGHEVVVACTKRGIDLRRMEWDGGFTEGFSTTSWYGVIRGLDHEGPWPMWLPLFAHLLRLTETAPGEVWLHMRSVEVVTSGLLKRYGKDSPSLASNARLIALLALRIVELCEEGGRIGPHNLLEVQREAFGIVRACVQAEERRA